MVQPFAAKTTRITASDVSRWEEYKAEKKCNISRLESQLRCVSSSGANNVVKVYTEAKNDLRIEYKGI